MYGQPISSVKWLDRNLLRANDYNPNKVARPEMRLLKLSIMEDGWTQPIVCRDDYEIVDGFHRWQVSGDPEISALTDGQVPVVFLRASVGAQHQRMSTIRHNRARGTHLVVRMADIVGDLLQSGLSPEEIMRRLQMEDEEVDRLADKRGMPIRAGKPVFNKGWQPGE